MLTNAPWFVPNAIIRNDLRVTTIRQEVGGKKKEKKTLLHLPAAAALCIPTTWEPPYSKGYLVTEDSNGIILKTWSLVLINTVKPA